MRRFVLCLISLVWLAISASAQGVEVKTAKFSVGDSPEWKAPGFDDSAWKTLSLDKTWDDQGISNDDSYAWYRIHVTIPSSIKNGATYIIPSHGVRFIKVKVQEEL